MKRVLLLLALAAPRLVAAQEPEDALDPRIFELEDEDEDADADADETGIRPDPVAAAQDAEEERKTVFGSPRYRFCHDQSFGADGTLGAEFCALFDEDTRAVCPAAAESCSKWQALSEDDEGFAGDRRRIFVNTEAEPREPLDLSSLLPRSLAQGILTVLLITLSVGLFAWILRRSQRGIGFRFAPAGSEDDEAETLSELPRTRAVVLLNEARQALQAGDAPLAARRLHVALLRFLDDTGRVRFHPSRTNGDYARRLRREPDLQSVFREAARAVERLRFGDGEVDAGALETLMEPVGKLLAQRAPPPAPFLALFVILAAAAVEGCGDHRVSAYRFDGPTGMSALPQLLRGAGLDVSVSNGGDEPFFGSVVVFRTAALPEFFANDPEAWSLMRELGTDVVLIDDLWRSETLLSLGATVASAGGSWRVEPWPEHAADPYVSVTDPFLTVLAEGEVRVPTARGFVPTSTVEYSPLLASPVRHHPLFGPLEGPASGVFLRSFDDEGEAQDWGGFYVFADRDLFTNASLTRPDNARAVTAFFASLVYEGDSIELVDELEGAPSWAGNNSTSDATRVLRASKLLPLILQAFLALLVLFAWIGSAFGPTRDPARTKRRAFAEHVDAVGRWYARTGEAGRLHAARLLSRWLHHVHRERVKSGNWSALAAELAEKHGLEPQDVEAALALDRDPSPPSALRPSVVQALSRLVAGRMASRER